MDFTTPDAGVKEAKTPKLGSGARFAAVEKKAAKSGASDPAAVAAAAGRKKYGNAKMAKMAAAGRHKEASAFEGFPVHDEPEIGLKEYNHNHDAKGEFASGASNEFHEKVKALKDSSGQSHADVSHAKETAKGLVYKTLDGHAAHAIEHTANRAGHKTTVAYNNLTNHYHVRVQTNGTKKPNWSANPSNTFFASRET